MLYKKCIKRILDVAFSSLALIIMAPFFVIICVLIRIDSKGNSIYKQRRIGLHGECFYIYKFRTMIANADKIGPLSTLDRDSRITKIGKLLRKSSIDELPQVLNILKGDMSFIGPRPDVYKEKLSSYEINRVKVRPGITGLAQVNGRSTISQENREKLDMKYVNEISFLMDFYIFLKTIFILFNIGKSN